MVYILFSLACLLVVVAVIDIKHGIIPDKITIPLMITGLVCSLLFPGLHKTGAVWKSVLYSLLGMVTGGGVLLLFGLLGDWLFKDETLGGGDIKLLAAIGTFLGCKLILLVLFLSSLIGIVLGLYLLIWRKRRIIPFGPSIAIASVIAMLCGKEIIEWYLSFY